MEAARDSDLDSLIELLLETKELARLADLVRGVGDERSRTSAKSGPSLGLTVGQLPINMKLQEMKDHEARRRLM